MCPGISIFSATRPRALDRAASIGSGGVKDDSSSRSLEK